MFLHFYYHIKRNESLIFGHSIFLEQKFLIFADQATMSNLYKKFLRN